MNKVIIKNVRLISSNNFNRVFSSTPSVFQNIPIDNQATQQTVSTKRGTRKVVEKGFYDTHTFINSLVEHKFTQEQAEQLCFLFKDITNYIADDIKNECVTRTGQELAIQQVMVHIGSLKKDMIILEKSEFSMLRNENEKLVMELKALKLQLQENTVKLKGGFTLDINLERNRTNEMSYEMTNKTQKLDSRIDSEISNVKALLEQFKADCIRYIAGSLFSGMLVLLGVMRLMT